MTIDPAPAWLAIINDATDHDQVRATALAAARLITAADGATFVLRDGECCFYVDEDAIAPLWRGQRFPLTECISGWAMLHNETAVVPHPFDDPRIPHEAYRATFVGSLVMVPMADDIGTVGAIGIYWKAPGRELGAGVLAELTQLAAAVARAVRRLGVAAAPWAPNFAIGAIVPPAGVGELSASV